MTTPTVCAFDFGQVVAYEPEWYDNSCTGRPTRSYTGKGRIGGVARPTLWNRETYYFVLDMADTAKSIQRYYTVRETSLLRLNPIGGLTV